MYAGVAPSIIFSYLNFDVIDIRLDQLIIFLIPKPRMLTKFESVGKLFTVKTWLSFLGTSLISLVAFKLIRNRGADEHIKKFVDVFFHLMALHTNSAVPKLPSSSTLRILFVFFAFFSLVISVILQGR